MFNNFAIASANLGIKKIPTKRNLAGTLLYAALC